MNDMNENRTTIVTSEGKFLADEEYAKWLKDLKRRFVRSQLKAATRVNAEMLRLYWSIGQDIVSIQARKHWGSGVIRQLSLDLRASLPDAEGLSVRNLEYMKRWYSFYNKSFIKSKQAVSISEMPEEFGLIPWGHHVRITYKCSDVEEALFYINKTIESNWSRRELEDSIDSKLYERQGKALTNFSSLLPEPQRSLASEILKDPYNFGFLTISKGYDERQLENSLMRNITRFLLELGVGFAFVGRQMELRMPGGTSFFPDLVFYHIRLRSYVVIELKVVDFMPEFIGKLNFYVTAADELLKTDADNPSIGLLICKSKDKTTVEWALRGIRTPIGVAEYQIREIVDQTVRDSLESKNSD